jgi:hypothetical protein
MTPEISDLAEIAEVDNVGQNPETLQHDGVQWWCDLNPMQPFGRPCERERGGGGEGGTLGRGREGTWPIVVCLSLLLGPLYILGRGSTNPSTKAP